MSRFSPPGEVTLARMLTPPSGDVSIVLDTDTYNEIDDQFALAYAVLAENIQVEAIYAAPFHNRRSSGPGDGMQKSYQEIHRILGRLRTMGVAVPERVCKGAQSFLAEQEKPVESEATRDLVTRAMQERERPLYVVAIGAITNVASALLIEPRVRERIVVVWLGGQPQYWPTAREFNLEQDLVASQIVLDCGVPLMRIPCKNVAQHLNTTVFELAHFLEGKNALCDYLFETTKQYMHEHDALSKVIWDVSGVAWFRDALWVPSHLAASPVLTSDCTWSLDPSRHLTREAFDVRRDDVFRDLFGLLAGSG